MYKIKTSELLSEKGIVEELTSIEVVKNISVNDRYSVRYPE